MVTDTEYLEFPTSQSEVNKLPEVLNLTNKARLLFLLLLLLTRTERRWKMENLLRRFQVF